MHDEGEVLLTEEEQEISDGKYGPGTEKTMEMLAKYRETFDTERMVRMKRGHLLADPHDWVAEMTEGANKVEVYVIIATGELNGGGQCTVGKMITLSELQVLPIGWQKGLLPTGPLHVPLTCIGSGNHARMKMVNRKGRGEPPTKGIRRRE